eukprot:scaffold12235_cov117-Isochrysis_galbana.AAC.8
MSARALWEEHAALPAEHGHHRIEALGRITLAKVQHLVDQCVPGPGPTRAPARGQGPAPTTIYS